MNILMVSDVYFPRVNGVSTSIQTFKNELQRQGHRVVVIAPEYPQESADEEDVIRVPSRRVLFDPEDRMMIMKQAMKLLPQLKAWDFDVVHIQTPFVAHYLGLKLAKALGLPTLVTYHTFFEEYLFHYLWFLPRRMMRYLARRYSRLQCNDVETVVVPSTAMSEVLHDYGVNKPMQILPTGIQLQEAGCNQSAVNEFKQGLGIDPGQPCLVHVGRIAHEKNIEFLIRVIHRVKQSLGNLAVIIAGEGPALDAIKKLSRQLGLEANIHFVGYLDRNTTLKHCYCCADAFVFASRTETQGLVLLEAMALAVPVVSTAVMGTRDILLPGKGCVVAEENIEDFSAALLDLLANDVKRKRLSSEARDYVEQWTSEEMASRLARVYQCLVDGELKKLDSVPWNNHFSSVEK